MIEYSFEDIVLTKGGFLRGPFGGDLKKEIFVPKGENTYKVYEQGVVLQKDASIGNYYIKKEYFDEKMNRFEVKPFDFLVSCSGAYYGAIYQLEEKTEPGVINQALLRIRLRKEVVDDKYFYYFFKHYIVNMIVGKKGDSTIPNFPPINVIRKLKFKLPKLSIQKPNASVLSNLDAKIELNNRINRELEQMAKLLYDYWFVQFDFPDANGKPYKNSGGKMVWNKELKREIPEGWEVDNLFRIADFTNGLAMQNFRPVNEDCLRVIKIREMREGFTDNSEFAKTDIPDKYIVENGDILFSWSASLEVIQWTRGRGGLNQHIFKVTSDNYPKSYYYHQLKNYLNHFKMMAENRKTTMGHITKDHLLQSKIVIATDEIIKKFDMIIQPIIDKITINDEESQHLTTLRDWLLPMLMNGQVRVGEAGNKEYKLNEGEMDLAAEPERIKI